MLLLNSRRSWKRWLGGRERKRTRPVLRPGRHQCPFLELLEDRTLPSTSNLFGTPIVSSTGSSTPVGIVSGDFNGDGKQDVITLNYDPTQIGSPSVVCTFSVLLGDGQGHFAPAANSPVSLGVTDQLPDAVLGDFNGDGTLDLAVVEELSSSVDVWLGYGAGQFKEAPGSPISVGSKVEPVAIVAGHFHDGGPLDLAVASRDGNVRILTGKGDGSFTVGTPIQVDGTPASLAVGDFNKDNNLDLAVASGTGQLDVLLGDGQGGFTKTPYNLPNGVGPLMHGLQTGDFNGDGKSDLVVTGDYFGNSVGAIDVLLGDGSGNFGVQPVNTFNGNQLPFAPTIAGDFNGDGTPDLLAIETNELQPNGTPEVLLGDGKGGFSDGGSVPMNNGYSDAAAIFTGKGLLDIAAVSNSTGTVEVLPNASTPAQVATTTQLASSRNPSVAGQPVTFTATVSSSDGTPTGSVTFTIDNGTPQSVPLANGQATFTAPALSLGSHTIAVDYAAQGNFTASSAVLTQVVRRAGTYTWSGAAPDDRWSDSRNWVGGVAPAPGDRLVFPADAAQQTNVNDFPAGSFFASLLFTQGASALAGGQYHISGYGITLGRGGITDKANHSSNEISLFITLGGPAGSIALQNSGDTLLLDGAVSDGPAAPTAGLVKSGAGDLVLDFNNTYYAGATLITRGEVDVEASFALGTGVAVVRAGATLRLVQTGYTFPLAVANPLVLAGTLATGSLASGPARWTGSMVLSGTAASFAPGANGDATSTLIVNGTITGDSGLTMQGAGTLVLAGNNVYTGATMVRAGTIEVTNPAGLGASRSAAWVSSGAMLAVSGGINVAKNVTLGRDARLGSLGGDNTWSGMVTLLGKVEGIVEVDADQLTITGVVTEMSVFALPVGLRKTGIGTLVLPGANTFTGGTHVVDGVLDLQNSGGLGTGNIQVDAGGTLTLDLIEGQRGQGFVFKQRLSLSGTGFENQGALELLRGAVTWSGAVQLDDVACMSTSGSNVLRVSGTISGDTLMAAGTGDVQLSGSNTYSGATFVQGGDLDVHNSFALGQGNGEGVTVAAGAALRLFVLDEPGFQPLTLLGQSQLVAENNNIWKGPITFAGTAQVVVNPGATLALSGFLTGTSDARLEESGGGSLQINSRFSLGGDNLFATVLGPGPLDVNQIQVDAGSLSLAFPGRNPGTFVLAENLGISLATGFTPAVGQQFNLVHNLTSGAIIGTFAGLPEGGTFMVDGFTFQITYKGGAGGHDVVVTRVA